MFIDGSQGPKKTHKVTYERKQSEAGPYYYKPTVHIGLNEQKWVPTEINPKDYSSVEKLKALFPGERIKKTVEKDGTIVYETFPYNTDEWVEEFGRTTIKIKGSKINICHFLQDDGDHYTDAYYENGKLVKVDKKVFWDDPYCMQ